MGDGAGNWRSKRLEEYRLLRSLPSDGSQANGVHNFIISLRLSSLSKLDAGHTLSYWLKQNKNTLVKKEGCLRLSDSMKSILSSILMEIVNLHSHGYTYPLLSLETVLVWEDQLQPQESKWRATLLPSYSKDVSYTAILSDFDRLRSLLIEILAPTSKSDGIPTSKSDGIPEGIPEDVKHLLESFERLRGQDGVRRPKMLFLSHHPCSWTVTDTIHNVYVMVLCSNDFNFRLDCSIKSFAGWERKVRNHSDLVKILGECHERFQFGREDRAAMTKLLEFWRIVFDHGKSSFRTRRLDDMEAMLHQCFPRFMSELLDVLMQNKFYEALFLPDEKRALPFKTICSAERSESTENIYDVDLERYAQQFQDDVKNYLLFYDEQWKITHPLTANKRVRHFSLTSNRRRTPQFNPDGKFYLRPVLLRTWCLTPLDPIVERVELSTGGSGLYRLSNGVRSVIRGVLLKLEEVHSNKQLLGSFTPQNIVVFGDEGDILETHPRSSMVDGKVGGDFEKLCDIIRLMLSRKKKIPFDLVHFLDFASRNKDILNWNTHKFMYHHPSFWEDGKRCPRSMLLWKDYIWSRGEKRRNYDQAFTNMSNVCWYWETKVEGHKSICYNKMLKKHRENVSKYKDISSPNRSSPQILSPSPRSFSLRDPSVTFRDSFDTKAPLPPPPIPQVPEFASGLLDFHRNVAFHLGDYQSELNVVQLSQIVENDLFVLFPTFLSELMERIFWMVEDICSRDVLLTS